VRIEIQKGPSGHRGQLPIGLSLKVREVILKQLAHTSLQLHAKAVEPFLERPGDGRRIAWE
jgi:hypothetical protein